MSQEAAVTRFSVSNELAPGLSKRLEKLFLFISLRVIERKSPQDCLRAAFSQKREFT